jgi:hypothetical protein
MHRRLFWIFATAISLSGCVQMTQHSNMMVFGTTTSVGLTVGTSATNVPEIAVGYKRQEAVLMPLLANTVAATGTNGTMAPCPGTKGTAGNVDEAVMKACKFVGTAENGHELDSYSVLASFGAKFGAGAGSNPTASGQIAQYFATGLAARELAHNGGAAVIATGPAATANANSVAAIERARTVIGSDVASANTIADKMAGAGDAKLSAYLTALDAAASSGQRFQRACAGIPSAQNCADIIRSRSTLVDVDWTAASNATVQ